MTIRLTNSSRSFGPGPRHIATQVAAYVMFLFPIAGWSQGPLPHMHTREAVPPVAQVAAAQAGDVTASLKLGNGFTTANTESETTRQLRNGTRVPPRMATTKPRLVWECATYLDAVCPRTPTLEPQ